VVPRREVVLRGLSEGARRALGIDATAVITPVGGGCIHDAVRVDVAGRSLFIKSSVSAPPGMFEVEASGLDALRRVSGDLGVPEVLDVGPTHLALEWIDVGGSSSGEGLGRGLARVHRTTSLRFGWPRDGWIGHLPQANGEIEAGGRFFAERRLLAQVAIGRDRLPRSLVDRVERFCVVIDEHLPPGEPALTHGDLWGGNWTTDRRGRPWIFDPAAHFGSREAELAFTTMFGGFPSAFYAAYQEAYPLPPGWRGRCELWNLYHQLTHANMFGGGYASSADRVLRRYVG
jgi:fructosamine-3-kinase